MRRIATLSLMVVALMVVAAACKKTTTNQNQNTTPTNTVTNTDDSTTTGTFSTNTSTNSGETETMTITSAGVSPKNLTIAVGTTVIFNNTDSTAHEISSDPHPAHTNYPEFQTTTAAGSSQQFTFTRAGSWSFHDHLFPFDSDFKGTIVVQ